MCERQNYDSTIAIAVLSQLPVLKHNSIGCTQVESIIICIAENIDHKCILYMNALYQRLNILLNKLLNK